MKKVWVISLGGSRIVPDKVDYKFLKQFKELISRHPSCKFVVVTGGGSVARKYMNAMKKLKLNTKKQSLVGIKITRLNARFLMKFFGKKANEDLPKNMKKIKNLLKKNHIIFCGALRWRDKNTSDGTAASIASNLKTSFINLTNIDGLYTSNPKTNKNAKLISKISWKKFHEKTIKIKFKAGQHFVLDQSAAKTIMNKRITTYIVGNLENLENIILEKKFKGTIIDK